MGRRKRIVVSLILATSAFVAAQLGAFSIGVLLGAPDPSRQFVFWALLACCFLVVTIACLAFLRIWMEPWARRRLTRA